MVKRCNTCAKKLNEQSKCTNEKCPNCLKEKLIAELESKKIIFKNTIVNQFDKI